MKYIVKSKRFAEGVVFADAENLKVLKLSNNRKMRECTILLGDIKKNQGNN
jgi:hypothetical protein